MNPVVIDIKLALRRLRQKPGFTLAAAVALALGIGSTTAIYSVLQAVVLRPLQFRNPEQLLLLSETQPAVPNASISAPDFKDWRGQAKTVDMSAFTGDGFNLTGRDRAERLNEWTVRAFRERRIGCPGRVRQRLRAAARARPGKLREVRLFQ